MRISDWSSDVCSSDLGADATLFFGVDQSRSLQHRQMFQKGGQAHLKRFGETFDRRRAVQKAADHGAARWVRERVKDRIERRCFICHMVKDRKSDVWGKSVSVRVDLGGRRLIKKKKNETE